MKRRMILVIGVCSLMALSSVADETLVVSSLLVDSSIAAPVLQLRVDRGDGNGYTVGLSGWTVGGEWRRRLAPSESLLLSADLTPLHAHSSNRVYLDGRRARDLEYDDASYRLRAGLRFSPSVHATTDVLLVGLKESIGNGTDPALVAFWKRPFAGVEIVHTASWLRSQHPLVSIPEGIEVTARGEALLGDRSWTRVSIGESGGRQFGRIHVREAVMAMTGSRLNTVSRFLAGGSWDLLGPSAFYGSRYAEYRVQRGVTGSLGGDVAIAGNWRAGLRASYLRSDAAHALGTSLNASTTWKTVGLNLGVGSARQQHGRRHAVAYAAIVAPLYRK